MAEKTTEPTLSKKDLESKVAELEAKAAALETANAEYEASLATATKTGIVSQPVKGTFTVELETPEGEVVTKKYGFKPGRIRVAIAGGAQVSSEALIRIANGKKATKEELAQYIALAGMTQEQAQERLAHLAQIGAGFLEERK